MTSASSTPDTTPSPIDAALPVICALVWMVPPPSSSAKVMVALAKPCPLSLARLHGERGGMRGGILLGDLERAGERQRHGAHLDLDLGLERLRPGPLEHGRALDARDDALEVEDGRVAVVERAPVVKGWSSTTAM